MSLFKNFSADSSSSNVSDSAYLNDETTTDASVSATDEVIELDDEDLDDEDLDDEDLDDEDLDDEESGLDFDADSEFILSYNIEAVAVPVASYATKSIQQAIKDNADFLGLPSDLNKLKARIGGQYLTSEALAQPPQPGQSIVLSFSHDSKGRV